MKAALCRAFERWGTPGRLRVDNGHPWGGCGSKGAGESLPPDLALWLVGIGVGVTWNARYRPQQNGKVERCQGVTECWADPARCESADRLQACLDEACRIQREAYPAVAGKSRAEAYPSLLAGGARYEAEAGGFTPERVYEWLGRGRWRRRVSKSGRISLYNREYSTGREHARRDVWAGFDAASREWVIRDEAGGEVARHPARELAPERIESLSVSRKKPRRDAPPTPLPKRG